MAVRVSNVGCTFALYCASVMPENVAAGASVAQALMIFVVFSFVFFSDLPITFFFRLESETAAPPGVVFTRRQNHHPAAGTLFPLCKVMAACAAVRAVSTGPKTIAVGFMFHFSRTNDVLTGMNFASAEASANFANGRAALARASAKLPHALAKRAEANAKPSKAREKVADRCVKLAHAPARLAEASATPAADRVKAAHVTAKRPDAPAGAAEAGAVLADTPVKPADRCAKPDRNLGRAAVTNEDGWQRLADTKLPCRRQKVWIGKPSAYETIRFG